MTRSTPTRIQALDCTRRRRARAVTGVLCLALLASSGCSSSRGTRKPLVYALSRDFYTSPTPLRVTSVPLEGCAALVMVGFMLLPFALDTALLPITVPHDLLFVE
jgi:hypothetical protein